jgi:hypothetical protein
MPHQKKDETTNAEPLSSSNTVQNPDGDATAANDTQVRFWLITRNSIAYQAITYTTWYNY